MLLRSGKRLTLIPDYSGLPEDSKELWREWIWALRTGGFPQTQGCLQDESGFCAFGVAIELNRVNLGGSWQIAPEKYGGKFVLEFRYPVDDPPNKFEKTCGFLPLNLGNLMGFPKGSAQGFMMRLAGIENSVSLTNLNDNFKVTFQEIAMILELAMQGGYNVDGIHCMRGGIWKAFIGSGGRASYSSNSASTHLWAN